MKYIQILFSTPMVQAEADGRKTETRRTRGLKAINENPDDWEFVRFWNGHAKFWEKHNVVNAQYVKCPYGQPGDVLWVRETYLWDWQDYPQRTQKYYVYKADTPNYQMASGEKWIPSIHMPKAACRTFLQVEEIKVERLQDISEQDAINEGVERLPPNKFKNYIGKNYSDGIKLNYASESFKTLWQSINGPTSWDANPYVWVIKFKPIPKPVNFC